MGSNRYHQKAKPYTLLKMRVYSIINSNNGNVGNTMGTSYNKLWKLLIERNMTIADLSNAVGTAPMNNPFVERRRDLY